MLPPALEHEIEEAAEERNCSPQELFHRLLNSEEEDEQTFSGPIAWPENLLDHIRETVLVVGPGGALQYVNHRPQEVLGTDLRKYVGEAFRDVLGQGPLSHIEQGPLMKVIRQVRNQEAEEGRVEVSIPVEPDSEMHLEVRVTLFDPGEEQVLLVARDVTDRVEMEQQLRERENRLRGLANSIPGVVFQFFAQPDGTYGTYFVSKHARAVLGISADEEDFYERFLEHVPPGYREDLVASIDEVVAQEQVWNHRMPFVRPSGERLWMQGLSTPTRRKGVLVFNGVLLDITQRVEYQQQLIEAKKEAETASRMKTALLENMSHELRTPLTAVLGYADLLIDELDEPLIKFAESIREGGHRLQDTLETVLDLAQLEGKELELHPQPVDAAQMIHQAARAHQADAQRKGLHLQTENLSDKVSAETDPRVLTQITTHLVNNAIKFTEQGSVTVRLQTRDDTLALQVEDTGIGVTEENKELIFDPFYQVSSGSTREYEGVGLGLTIVKKLTDMVGGQIELNSEPDSGTTVTVSLPRVLPMQLDSSSTSESFDQRRSDVLKTNQQVLLVEDDTAMQELMKQMIPSGIQLDVAGGPKSARSHIRETRYDLILMDINLQAEENGVDLLRYVQNQSDSTPPSVVALTAYAMPGDADSFLEEGFDEYMAKPFNRKSLQNLLDDMLDRSI